MASLTSALLRFPSTGKRSLRSASSSTCQPKEVKVVRDVRMKAAKFKGTYMREKKLSEMIEQKVNEAKQACEGDETSDECKVAWDEVEEVSQAKADLRLKLEKQEEDPLEFFCQDNPETEECRIYED